MDLKIIILRKLFRHRYVGGKHTDISNLMKGIPKHLGKDVKNTAKELIKDGLLLTKPTSYGFHISLNPERLDDILKIIEEK